MNSRSRRNIGSAAKLEMSAMIDVVFLLLIFFIVIIKPEDLLATLAASSPAPDEIIEKPNLLNIDVYQDSYVVNGTRISLERMEKALIRAGEFSPRQSVIITCALDSHHSSLIKCMDICAKAKLKNLSLFTR